MTDLERNQPWWALVGPVPSPIPAGVITKGWDQARVLDGPCEIGPLRLRPGDKALIEYLRSEPSSLSGTTTFESHPIIVEGDHVLDDIETRTNPRLAYPMGEARARAAGARALHRLCGLISLAWGEAWQVRSAPTFSSRLPAEVPESWTAPSWHLNGPLRETSPEPLPPWVKTGWSLIELDGPLQRALAAWHQGQLLEPVFPSFALVAFTSAIEEVGRSPLYSHRLGKDPPPCEKCKSIGGSTARFWKTVGLVEPGNEVRRLKKMFDPYGHRSQTVHRARLHGIESVYGDWFLFERSPIGLRVANATDPIQAFVLQTVPKIGSIAAALLHTAFGATAVGDPPSTEPASPCDGIASHSAPSY